eukprot:13243543-Heterocapsa_arctica.AAC.1
MMEVCAKALRPVPAAEPGHRALPRECEVQARRLHVPAGCAHGLSVPGIALHQSRTLQRKRSRLGQHQKARWFHEQEQPCFGQSQTRD